MSDATRGAPGTPQWFGLWNDAGQLDQAATLAQMPVDDLTAAQLIMAERPGQLHYVPAGQGTWYIWDSRCHRPDERESVQALISGYAERAAIMLRVARQLVLQRSRNVVLAADPDASNTALETAARKAWAPWEVTDKYHQALRKSAGRNSLVSYLAALCGTAEADMADRWPDWLNCANGMVHLPTGTIYPHDPQSMVTYCLDVPYIPGAACPHYWALHARACGNVPAVADHLWRVLGYSLTGANPEQKIFFLSGPTASGKSQLLEAISTTLGTLAHNSQNTLISVSKNGRNARVEWSCRGARLVTITETSGHNTTDEAQVKRLTGESWISVDRHYSQTEVKIPVTFTIVQATNEMQTLTNFDAAMRRRIEVLPMGQPIPEEERVVGLAKLLAAEEAEGILAMLVAGAMAYYRDGLHAPVEVLAETARYESEQNTLADFLADCTMPVPVPFGANGNTPAVSSAQMWRAYQAYSRGGPHLRKHQFLDQMRQHPGISYREGSRRFEGIALVPEIQDRMQEQS